MPRSLVPALPLAHRPWTARTVALAACALAVLLGLPLTGQTSRAAQVAEEKACRELQRTLDRWHAAWSNGRIDLDDPAIDAGRLHRIYRGGALFHRPKESIPHREAIRRLFDAVPEHPSLEVALATLAIAASDLGETVDPSRGVLAVRSRAREALAQIDDATVLDALIRLASGDPRVTSRGDADSLRLAALLTLGRSKSGVARVIAERQLASPDPLVRLAAAESLLERSDPRSLDQLADQLATETDPAVCQILAMALSRGLPGGASTLGAAETRRALGIALDALGRVDWRVDIEVVELCRALRSTDAIPALIAVLERGALDVDGDDAGNGFLRTRTHEVLRTLTGAIFGADEPARWREFWEREKATFEMPPPRDRRVADGGTSSGFFGIPIQGRRVLFLIDKSGSMGASHAPLPTGRGTVSTAVPDTTRLAWAKHELLQAVDGLPRDAFFDVIIFSSGVTRWRGSLTPATDGRRKALREQLGAVGPGGGTNIWGALERALDLRSVRWGDATPAAVDEIFLLSDGEPSVGEITHTEDILDAIRESNRLRRVRIHTIYMGPSDSAFMQQLATDNGGTYVRTGR